MYSHVRSNFRVEGRDQYVLLSRHRDGIVDGGHHRDTAADANDLRRSDEDREEWLGTELLDIEVSLEAFLLRSVCVSSDRDIHEPGRTLFAPFDMSGENNRAHARSINGHAGLCTIVQCSKDLPAEVVVEFVDCCRLSARNDQGIDLFKVAQMANLRRPRTGLLNCMPVLGEVTLNS